ncbi:LysR family transcriptional regulator [Microbacterium sp. RU33B]|uniref:LysR family transcriptional regulator n=1 Tax=Microbacterium sp. RU33B TaxID=1907390 RepID=UPI00095C5DAC|nr:LysR family transcriptional regulator [Microbacterium sp. RU33B]SIT86871.1 DNA-binding transcriptional regulator, LysR family [Microbacterium sp. RU33B]
MFELRRLRLLHELALRGTLSAVAEALSYSPSTISQQLAQLEKDAGVPLLVPDGRRVRLTEQGEALAAHAARALALEEQIRGELEQVQPGIAPVRVAVMQTAALGLVPAALGILRERAPGLRVELAEVPPEEGLFELAARGFDLVIAEQYPGVAREHRSGLERDPLGRDPIRLALPRSSRPEPVTALRDRAWVMEPVGTASRQWAVQQCRAAGFEPDVRFELADLTAHVRLIAAGHAVGFLPDLLWAGEKPRVRLVELPGSPDREIFTAVRRSSTTRAGIRIVRDALRAAFDLHAGTAVAGSS